MTWRIRWGVGLVVLLTMAIAVPVKSQPKKPVNYQYLVYTPPHYDTTNQTFPLVIYLHGSSLRGSDLNRVKAYGLPYYANKGTTYPFVLVAPQCPGKKSWVTDNWFGPLYDTIKAHYRIDTNRVYVMGMSLGGYGTWHVALDYPDVFAALVPICGGCLDSVNICNMAHIPTWAFHGQKDKAVAFSETEKLVKRLEQCRANITFTALPNKGHNLAYLFNSKEVLEWMLQQSKTKGTNIPAMPDTLPPLETLPAQVHDLYNEEILQF